MWHSNRKENDLNDREEEFYGEQKIIQGPRRACTAGVCGGLGEFLGIDPTIVRLVFVLLSLGFGSGLLFYILAALIIPNPPAE